MRLPPLESIEDITRRVLSRDEKFMTTFEKNRLSNDMEFEAFCFPQVWASTCTGFDIMPDGTPAIGGAAMTKEYTTVIHELNVNWYIVFFGLSPAYVVEKMSDNFSMDLKGRNMVSVSRAKERYKTS